MATRNRRGDPTRRLAARLLLAAAVGLLAIRPAPARGADPPSLVGARVTVELQSGKTVEGVGVVKVRAGRVPGKPLGTTAHGENIAVGPLDGREANTCWFQSPVHHGILLYADYRRVGAGRTGRFFTELLGK